MLPARADVKWPDQVLVSVNFLRIFLAYIPALEAWETDVDARVTNEPVDRDLRRRQLAQRLVVHQARTQTIFRLTGLSRHQLATLRQRWRVTTEMRHRGPPPTSFAVFRSTLRVRAESAALAVFWRTLGDVGTSNGRPARPISTVEFGEHLCEVFEAYLACFPKSELDLEHLALLTRGLEEADAIALSKCSNCEAVILVDLLGLRRRLCPHCQRAADTAAPMIRESDSDSSSSPPAAGEAVQQELF